MAAALTDQVTAAPGFTGPCAYEIKGTIWVTEVWAGREDQAAWFDGTVRPNLPQPVDPNVFELLNIILPDAANQPTGDDQSQGFERRL